jgi:hypothetical protein
MSPHQRKPVIGGNLIGSIEGKLTRKTHVAISFRESIPSVFLTIISFLLEIKSTLEIF